MTKKKRLSADEWLAARLAWESDPSMTAFKLADIIGVTKQAVSAKMKRDADAGDEWTKKVSMREIAERAHAAADRSGHERAPDLPKMDRDVDGQVDGQFDREVNKKAEAGTPVTVPPGTPDPVSERAAVIARHRKEWSVPRGLTGEAVTKRDFDRAKLAKITSETLKIIQDGERKAWGLDAVDPGAEAGKTVVVIERT